MAQQGKKFTASKTREHLRLKRSDRFLSMIARLLRRLRFKAYEDEGDLWFNFGKTREQKRVGDLYIFVAIERDLAGPGRHGYSVNVFSQRDFWCVSVSWNFSNRPGAWSIHGTDCENIRSRRFKELTQKLRATEEDSNKRGRLPSSISTEAAEEAIRTMMGIVYG